MNISVRETGLDGLQADALLLGISQGTQEPQGLLAEVDRKTNGLLKKVLGSKRFSGKSGQVEVLYPVLGLDTEHIVLFGLGDKPLSAEEWRKAVSKAIEPLHGKAASAALLLPESLDAAMAAEAAAESAVLSAYRFEPYKTEHDPEDVVLDSVVLLSDSPSAKAAAERGAAMADAVCWVRDLSNEPSNKGTIARMLSECEKLPASLPISLSVKDYEALQKEGFGCLVAVGKGSFQKPAFAVLEYKGAPDANAKPVVLVGKGITFDTGGICIKPRAGMEEMKTDMHGAATVMAILRVAAERKLPFNLVGLLPFAENMPEANANKPGDILTAYNGTTVEVGDTDAEGRLILADGVAYAAKHYEPRCIIDVATLTGSIIMSLAYEATGLFTNDDDLARQIVAAGEETGERCWRLPMWDAYKSHTQSDIADLRNASKEKGDAIAGAVFINAFAGGNPYVHLDIGGTSYLHDAKAYNLKGSTGVGVRLLVKWLESL